MTAGAFEQGAQDDKLLPPATPGQLRDAARLCRGAGTRGAAAADLARDPGEQDSTEDKGGTDAA